MLFSMQSPFTNGLPFVCSPKNGQTSNLRPHGELTENVPRKIVRDIGVVFRFRFIFKLKDNSLILGNMGSLWNRGGSPLTPRGGSPLTPRGGSPLTPRGDSPLTYVASFLKPRKLILEPWRLTLESTEIVEIGGLRFACHEHKTELVVKLKRVKWLPQPVIANRNRRLKFRLKCRSMHTGRNRWQNI